MFSKYSILLIKRVNNSVITIVVNFNTPCKSEGYKQWDCFLFSDYSIRRQLATTFDVRHLPLSDGNDEENFEGKLVFDWAAHAQRIYGYDEVFVQYVKTPQAQIY